MDTILVTGGKGLVGFAIQNISNNYPQYKFIYLSSIDCDLTKWDDTIAYFQKIKPTFVIHLAANVGGLFKNMNYKVEMLEINVMININVLKASHMVNVKKLIGCLSTCIFPDKTTYPINESMLQNGPPHSSNDAYAYAKRLLEIHTKAYHEEYNDNFVCIIPTNIYGPYDNYNLNDAHVIPALIHKCYLAKKMSKPFIVSGSGRPLRQFIYSEDLAKLIMLVLEKYNSNDSIILSVDENHEVSIEYIARQIAQCFEYEDMIQFDTSLSDGQYKKTADNSKMIQNFGEFNFIPIGTGIKKSVEWFINNYNTCRK